MPRPLINDDAHALPQIVAHRGGGADYPENTLLAIAGALRNRADLIWLTVQLSRDGEPVLYRPASLAANTQDDGPVRDRTLAQLQQLNAGWHATRTAADGTKAFPYRHQAVPIPSLAQALAAIPPSVPVILDMKALPAQPQANAVARVLDKANAWDRVWIYSTDHSYQAAFDAFPRARIFEARDATRDRLAAMALGGTCANAPPANTLAAFEFRRKMQLLESFTLGEARSNVVARLWTPAAVACFRHNGPAWLLAIGVDTAEDYRAAACLGIDAVMTDSPAELQAIRAATVLPLRCHGTVQ